MSALLWVSEAKDDAIDLGNPLQLLEAFAEMEKVIGDDTEYETFADLFGVPDATMEQDDVGADWLADVRKQAKEFLAKHGDELGDGPRGVLKTLADEPSEGKSAG